MKLSVIALLLFALLLFFWLQSGEKEKSPSPVLAVTHKQAAEGKRSDSALPPVKQATKSISEFSGGEEERGFHGSNPSEKKNAREQEPEKQSAVAEEPDDSQALEPMDAEEAEAVAGDEEGAQGPMVYREHLIGGANVEWIPPKPKDPDDKFGEPPE